MANWMAQNTLDSGQPHPGQLRARPTQTQPRPDKPPWTQGNYTQANIGQCMEMHYASRIHIYIYTCANKKYIYISILAFVHVYEGPFCP